MLYIDLFMTRIAAFLFLQNVELKCMKEKKLRKVRNMKDSLYFKDVLGSSIT